MAYRNEMFVDKLLVWDTEIPFEDKPRRSSYFWLMGSEWYLQFSYRNGGLFHDLSLHRVTVEDEPQQIESIRVRTHVANKATYDLKYDEEGVQTARVQLIGDRTTLWYSGNTDDCIFQLLPSLRRSGEIQFVCKFCGQPPSAFQLEIGTETTLENRSAEEPSNLECLSSDLGRLLENEQLPDVRLNCGGRTFPAHRFVLAARSEVFAAMFRNKMAESETGGVDVTDFDPDVIGPFLRYLYTGKLTVESGDAAASLFAAADKYAVDSLKRACTRWIVSGLTEGNCVRYLTLADLHSGDALKREVVAFVCGHPEVMLGEEWAGLTRTHPEVALEVHRGFVRSKTET